MHAQGIIRWKSTCPVLSGCFSCNDRRNFVLNIFAWINWPFETQCLMIMPLLFQNIATITFSVEAVTRIFFSVVVNQCASIKKISIHFEVKKWNPCFIHHHIWWKENHIHCCIMCLSFSIRGTHLKETFCIFS